MTPEKKQRVCYHVRGGLLILFALAYIAGIFVFAFEFQNYWAVAGFTATTLIILVRIAMFYTPDDKLYRIFPAGSVARGLFQSMCLLLGCGFFALGFYLMAQGLKRHQRWVGDSYYCGMTGVWMASKWSFFLGCPLYNLRPDTMSPELVAILHDVLEDSKQDREPGCCATDEVNQTHVTEVPIGKA